MRLHLSIFIAGAIGISTASLALAQRGAPAPAPAGQPGAALTPGAAGRSAGTPGNAAAFGPSGNALPNSGGRMAGTGINGAVVNGTAAGEIRGEAGMQGQMGNPGFISGIAPGVGAMGAIGASASPAVVIGPSGISAGVNNFGPANSRANAGTNGPGRAGNLPVRGGSQSRSSAFQGNATPFAPNSFMSTMASLPPSAFSPNVARPSLPSFTSNQQIPTYYPRYLPNGEMNPNVGPNRPMANGQVVSGDAAALSLAAQQTAAQNGMIFQNGQWWHQSPTGAWEYYRGNSWNEYPAGAARPPGVPPAGTTTPPPSGTALNTPVYTYEVPAY